MTDTTRAMLWMIGSIFSFIAMAVAGRQVSATLDTFEIMTYRSVIGVAIVLSVARLQGRLHEVKRDRLGLHALRNVAHFTGQNLWFYAIATIPFAQVFALEFTTPIWAILLAPLLLGERLTRSGLIAGACGLAGILIVTRPGSVPLSPGLLAAAACAVFFALTALMTRRLTRDQSIVCILFYLTTMQAVFGLLCAGWDGDMVAPTLTTGPWLVLIGCAGLMAHFCLTTALSLAPASVVMPIDFARLPLAALVGTLFFSETLDPALFAGAVLIFGGNYYNILKSRKIPA